MTLRVNRQTQLHVFCEASDVASARLCLKAGEANVDYQDRLQQTPLFYACGSACIDAIILLVTHGANLDIKNMVLRDWVDRYLRWIGSISLMYLSRSISRVCVSSMVARRSNSSPRYTIQAALECTALLALDRIYTLT